MATCEERFEIYEAKRFGKVTWEAFTAMNEKQMVEVMQHLSEEQRECFMAAIAKHEEDRKVRWAAKTKAEKELFGLVTMLTQETLTKYMEETEADLNSQDEFGWTLLMRAALCGYSGVARMLLEANVEVDVQESSNGRTALFYAAEVGKVDCVAQLIDAQADLELRNYIGMTALYGSIVRNQYSTAALLLEAKANAWAEDVDGDTPMSYALGWHFDNKEIMSKILQQSPNENGVTALMLAASRGDVDAIPKLLELGENPELEDKDGMTALMMAMMPEEDEHDWHVECKLRIINMLRGDRTDAELNEMRRVLCFPKVPPPLNLSD